MVSSPLSYKASPIDNNIEQQKRTHTHTHQDERNTVLETSIHTCSQQKKKTRKKRPTCRGVGLVQPWSASCACIYAYLRPPAEDIIPLLESVPLVGQPLPPRVKGGLELGRFLIAPADHVAIHLAPVRRWTAARYHPRHVRHYISRLPKLDHLLCESFLLFFGGARACWVFESWQLFSVNFFPQEFYITA